MTGTAPRPEAANWLQRPLAIVGMACRLPGAPDLDSFWQLLESGGYAVERMSDAKLDRATYFDPVKGRRGKTYSDIGGFVDERPVDFALLGMTADEGANWDQCHLNLCEVAASACVDAGYQPLDLPTRRVGVFIGHSGGTTLGGDIAFGTLAENYVQLLQELPSLVSTSCDKGWLSEQLLARLRRSRPIREKGRPATDAGNASALISQTLGLDGPALSIDAACASSLVALALGSNSLHAGESDMVIVGGASYNKADSLILFSHAQSCSATATRPFDEEADGLVGSEGYVAIVIKTLDRAIRDKDQIRAVIRGIGISSDGRGKSLWAPRKEGQYAAIERAYSETITPDTVQLIEAHATSTQVGDATEMEALAAFYKNYCHDGKQIPVGSVKSNIGHTLETAGLAGLVKAILAIDHATIPPSINISKLNHAIPWREIPLTVARSKSPWPDMAPEQPRRAAVNAFGIGGLNVHVVVEQFAPQALPPSSAQIPKSVTTPPKWEPIALVGRGVVLPGSASVKHFSDLLRSPTNQLRSAPADRAGNHRGGFCTEFQYDWRKHKVPPKQIAQANPLQFMLLDAADQAMEEAGYKTKDFNRKATAVVVGSVFGGDFGNALFGGLRLPEIRNHLQQLLAFQSVEPPVAETILQEFEERFLKQYPALLDETGSFTSSTLASRLSKTLDLAGGAMAVDAGNASGFAALNSACRLLQSGTASMVVCAAAQRSLDRSAIENHAQFRSTFAGIDPQDFSLGEGVVVFLLKRLSDAKRDGDKVIATITDLAVGMDSTDCGIATTRAKQRMSANFTSASDVIGRTGIAQVDERVIRSLELGPDRLKKSPAIESIGDLQAAQGLVDLLTCSLNERSSETTSIVAHGGNGQVYILNACRGEPIAQPNVQSSQHATASLLPAHVCVYRFEAPTISQLQDDLKRCIANPDSIAAYSARSQFADINNWRATIVCQPEELQSKLPVIASQLGNRNSITPLLEQGMLWSSPADRTTTPRVAWLFPGQGSQYDGMLQSLVQISPVARRALDEANALLKQISGETFEQIAWKENPDLGESVWHTQAAVLVADYIMLSVMRSQSVTPAVVAGHSFGEIPSLLAAGAVDLSAALHITRARCQAITGQVPTGLAMLSVSANAQRVDEIIRQSHINCMISHHNAPEQTVVGGRQASIATLAMHLEEQGIASRILPVPTAFHTPWLEPAKPPFRKALQELSVKNTVIPMLSGVTQQLTTHPDNIRDALAEQLTQKLDFTATINQLELLGITIAIEVGPQQVLTKLTRQNSDRILVVSTDHSKRDTHHQILLANALIDIMTNSQTNLPGASNISVSLKSPTVNAPLHFDATQIRRSRLRSASEQRTAAILPPTSSINFDATNTRRSTKREASRIGSIASVENGQVESRTLTASTTTPSAPTSTEPIVASNGVYEPAEDSSHGNSTTENISETISRFLIDFVVEQTGYPAEIIDLDWDIEADLGIDSIKKAQLFGELREFFDLESKRDQIQLDDFRTLRQIVALLVETPGKGDWLKEAQVSAGHTISPQETLSSILAPQEFRDAFATSVADDEPTSTSTSYEVESLNRSDSQIETELSAQKEPIRRSELQRILVDFVVEQTGYPPEIVTMDADLEADLGIDSIKKAQLFGELRELFQLNIAQLMSGNASDRDGMSAYRTLDDILDVLESFLANSTVNGDQSKPIESKVTVAELSVAPEPDTAKAPSKEMENSPAQGSFFTITGDKLHGDQPVVPSDETSSSKHFAIGQRFSDRDFKTDRGFIEAATRNVRRLASLRKQLPSSSLELANGCSTWCQTRAKETAQALAIAAESLFAFDVAIQSECRWHRFCNSDTLSSSADEVAWLVYLPTSQWTDPRIGLTRLGSSVEIALPGCLTPTASIKQNRLLIVGSADEPAAYADHAKLSKLICHGNFSSVENTVAITRSLELNCNWWIFVADQSTGKQALIECHDGTLVIEKDTISSKCDVPHDSLAIGLSRSNEWIFKYNEHSLTLSSLPITNLETTKASLSDEPKQISIEPTIGELSEVVESKAPPSTSGSTRIARMSDAIAARYVLRMSPAPIRESRGRLPTWSGPALIVGENAVATQLEARLKSIGVEVFRFRANVDPNELSRQFLDLVEHQTIPHLFVTTPCDNDARISLDERAWSDRRNKGIMGIFWLCQKWLSHIVEHGLTDDASLVGVGALGGDFGLSGNLYSAEGGAIGGLFKSILIESWMQGYRTLPIKLIDSSSHHSPAEIVSYIWQELAVPSFDLEVAYINGTRHIVRAIPSSIDDQAKPITRNGVWVCTGGARGITAYVAEQLAKRYDLSMHLLGTSPLPQIDPMWHELDDEGLRKLKVRLMTEVRGRGENPVKFWQDTEKAIEIDATLIRLRKLGISVHYHPCDVANRDQLADVLDRVRAISGPITGILHGAGVGRDSRFDRKQPEKVNQCIGAKVDGALSLIQATLSDPIEYFVGFGSISGRFGANGHTDYSLSNEMLCKTIDWLKHLRPNVKAVGFHWHAWGDVGMATKPETRLALEMIDMQFMPAAEGVEHLIRELESASQESEVLITDDRYYRMFYPAETLVSTSSASSRSDFAATPLLDKEVASNCGGDHAYATVVNPLKDPFLVDHRLDGRPLLPFVIAAEMMAEAARRDLQSPTVILKNMEALGAVRFFSDISQELRVETKQVEDGRVICNFFSDFHARDGRKIEANRRNFRTDALASQSTSIVGSVYADLPTNVQWHKVAFPSQDSRFYVGWSLQRLRKFALSGDTLVGRISAPALVELAGGSRPVLGWILPSSAMDACMFASGILAWQRVAPGTALPIRFGEITVARIPSPGEACEVHIRLKSHGDGKAIFDFTLYGVDGLPVLNVVDYEVAWTTNNTSAIASKTSTIERG